MFNAYITNCVCGYTTGNFRKSMFTYKRFPITLTGISVVLDNYVHVVGFLSYLELNSKVRSNIKTQQISSFSYKICHLT